MKMLMTPAVLGGLLAIVGASPALANFDSLEAAQAAARDTHKPLLIDFYTEW